MAGEKRSKDSDEVVRAETTILLDIEGTTTSISFLKDTLLHYVQENLKKYVAEKWDHEEFKADLEKLKKQAKEDEEGKVTGFVPISGATPEEEKESVVKNVLWQMDEDRKTGALKQLQGHMWRQAYESGAVKGHVYDDVPKALESWTAAGRKIYIYSSGSVEAQKLLFSHSQSKDLTKYLSDYFDTEMGAKVEAASYKNILSKLNVDALSVLFLTDAVKEAQAAKEAGIAAAIVIRKGNTPLSEEDKSAFPTITSFEDISFQTSSKRQKVGSSDEKNDAATAEPLKKEIHSKIEVKDKSETDSKTESPCEPMDTSDDILDETNKKTEAEKPEEKESKIVIEAEQKEEEKIEVPAATKEESKKPSTEDSKENSADAKSAESKVEPEKTQDKKDEEMEVDEPDKVAKLQEVIQKVEAPVVKEIKQNLPEEKKETKTESSKAKDSESKSVPIPESKTEDKKTPELKPDTEAKSDSSEKVDNPEVTEEKVKKVNEAIEESAAESKEEIKPEPKAEKIPEIVVEKASEIEAEGISKVEEAKEEKTKEVEKAKEAKEETKPEVQPELRSEKPEEKSEGKKEVPEKLKETEKAKEVENGKAVENEKGVENGKAVENAKAEVKEEEQKLNGKSNGEQKQSNGEQKQSNGEQKQSNGEQKQSNGIPEKEKSDSKSMEATSSQNGDTETSETSETIKIKKLVDSTADAAVEPELVTPPVAVAASS